MPTVSIITPTYNAADFIGATVDSVLAQTFQDWELLIVDDCSTDATPDLLDRLAAHDARIRITRLAENSGPAFARNTAIQQASGRYIAFIDADDLWLPEKLERQLDFMRSRNVGFSFTAYEKMDDHGTTIGERTVPQSITYDDLLANNVVGCLTAMYDTEAAGKVEMPLIRKRQDLGLWLRLLRILGHGEGLAEVLARYRVRSNSVSSNKLSAARYTWKLYREVEMIPLPKALVAFVRYAIGGILRR